MENHKKQDQRKFEIEIINLLEEWMSVCRKGMAIKDHKPFFERSAKFRHQYIQMNDDRWALLTRREREVIRFLCMGHSSMQIAEQLYVSKHTIASHKSNIYKKLKIKNVIELIRFGYLVGLVE